MFFVSLLKFAVFVFMILSLGLFNGCSFREFAGRYILDTQEKTDELDDSAFGVVTRSETIYRISDMERALDEALNSGPDAENLILLVHGAGLYPDKAFRRGEFENAEKIYKAKVVMFNWPSYTGLTTIPRANARVSGKALGEALGEFDRATQKRKDELRGMNKVLLLHSMGNDVFKNAMEAYRGELPTDLFDVTLMAAPEVDLKGHAEWVEKIDFSPNVFVALNPNDRVLAYVKYHLNEARLGMQLKHLDGTREPLARNAVYLNNDRGSGRHSYHTHGQSPGLAALLRLVVANRPTAMTSPYVEPTPTPNVYAVVN